MEQLHIEQIIDPDECRKEAEELYIQFKEQIESQINQPVDGITQMGEPYPKLFEHYLVSVPEDIQSQYWAHGVTRGRALDQLAATLSILRNKAIVGDTSRLRKSGFQDAWTDGGFLLISKKDNELIPGKTPEERARHRVVLGKKSAYSVDDVLAIKVDIGAIVVNAEFYPLVEELRKRFPETKILYARGLSEYLLKK